MDGGCAGGFGGYEDKRMETEGAEERKKSVGELSRKLWKKKNRLLSPNQPSIELVPGGLIGGRQLERCVDV
jgi:hypothetical protein